MPEGHGYPNESEQERKQRIKKLKAKTSKMRLGNIYDEQEENKDKGSAANIKTNTKGNRAFNKRRKEMGLDPVPVVKPKPSLIASLKKKQKIAADDFDDSRPAQLKLRLAAVEKDNYLKMEKDWDEFDEQSASLERDMDMSTDMNDINSYGSELEQRYNYRNKNAPKKPSVSKL